MIVVLLVAAGAAWESAALRALGDDPGTVVLKRCVDVDDLLATAAAGQAEVAVVGLDAPGLDLAAVDHLRRHGVRAVAVAEDGSGGGADGGLSEAVHLRASRLGLPALVAARDVDSLPVTVLGAAAAPWEPPTTPRSRAGAGGGPSAQGGAPDLRPDQAPDLPPDLPPDLARGVVPPGQLPPPVPGGRVVVVWGPAGAPGRSTVAAGIAAELGRRGRRTILVDADSHAASIAQQLGILDEVSGLLAATRLVTAGQLEEHLATVQRGLDHQLSVVTGLPRPDRWVEVRPGAVESLLAATRERGQVVVDTAAPLEQEPGAEFGTRPGRNQVTLEALASADELVVVGSADPIGLSRLARGLVELRDVVGGRAVRVVINRMRPSLGWSEKDVTGMVHGFARVASLHFLPHDQAAADHALVTGRTLVESGEAPLGRALSSLVDALAPPTGPAPAVDAAPTSTPGGVRRRKAGRGRRR